MRRLGGLLFLFSVVLVLSGCPQPGQQVYGSDRTKRVRTTVSLSPSTTEILGMLADGTTLIGRSSSCNYPAYVGQAEVVADVKPEYEKIRGLKPDIILYDKAVYSDADIQKLKDLGLETLEMNVHSVDEFITWLYLAGSKLGRENRFSEYVDKIFAERQKASVNLPNPKPKVAIIMGGGDGSEYMIDGVNSFQADLVRAAGGITVGPKADRFVNANAESLIELNPDVIVTTENTDALLSDPRLRSIAAISKRAVARVNPDVLLRAGVRVNDLIKELNNVLVNFSRK